MNRRSFLLTLSAAAAARPARVLLLTGSSDEPYHHWRETTAALQELLPAGRFHIQVAEAAAGAPALDSYDAVLVNYNGPRFARDLETAIERFVGSGGGLAAFHQACYGSFFGMVWIDKRWRAGDRGWEEWPAIIGASWEPEKIGHAKRGRFEVEWRRGSHPILKDAPRSFTADDELYHRLTVRPGVEVLADAHSDPAVGGTGQREPLIWANRYGKGRVFFTTLGHDVKALSQPGMTDAMSRGLDWAARKESR